MKGFVLHDMVLVTFKKDSRCMAFKSDFSQEDKEIDFLSKKADIPFEPQPLPGDNNNNKMPWTPYACQ